MSKSEKTFKWTWFKLALLILLILYVFWGISYAVIESRLADLPSTHMNYEKVTLNTERGDTLVLEREAVPPFPRELFYITVTWNGQEKESIREQQRAIALDHDWYQVIGQIVNGESCTYEFSWGTVTVADGVLDWNLPGQDE